ncbi:MAG TPA: sugar transferase [Bdellovibrionota bacterium]|jgi:lipopolysaccharide/colanic/teichoic acid biosynthesis glycosyltransferase
MSGTFRLVRGELGFILNLLFATFLLVAFAQDADSDHVKFPYIVVWTFLVTAVSYTVLDIMKYLDSYRTRPSRTDLVTLYLTLLLPFLVLKQVFFAFTGLAILRYREIFLGLPFVALSAWCYRYVAGILFEKSGMKRHLWALLDGAETVELRRELVYHGLAPYYEITASPDDADLVVISRVGSGKFESSPDLLLAHLSGIPVRDLRHLLAEVRGREDLEALDLWFFLLTATPQRRMFQIIFRLKSVVEPVIACLLLVLFSPVIALAALGVLLSGPGPIFYRQKRLGYMGREFQLVKFRSMIHHAEAEGPAWAGQQGAKVTRIGAFLRKSHIDEIPQLWNVLKGEMSFVGPRPERPEYYSLLREDIPLFWMRTLVRPGITGWAQVMAGYASSVEESRQKLEFDLYYMKRMSPLLDLKIFAKTILLFVAARDDLAR